MLSLTAAPCLHALVAQRQSSRFVIDRTGFNSQRGLLAVPVAGSKSVLGIAFGEVDS